MDLNDFEPIDRGEGIVTHVRKEFKDRMQEVNMCNDCEMLNAEFPGSECPIATTLASLNRLATIYSPVFECLHFEYKALGRPTIIQGPPPEENKKEN